MDASGQPDSEPHHPVLLPSVPPDPIRHQSTPQPVNIRVRLAAALLITWAILAVGYRLARMDRRFFQRSPYGLKGLTLYLVGDYAGAAAAYRAGLEWRLTSSGHLGNPAMDEVLSRQLSVTPSAALTAGEMALERGELEEARRAFASVLERDPDQFDALLLSSVVEVRAGALEDAIDWLKRALRTDAIETRRTSFLYALETVGRLRRRPSRERPQCLLAHYYRYLRIFDDTQAGAAIACAKRAIAAHDRPDDAYLTIGAVSYRTQKPEQALRAVLKAVEINPRNAEALRWAAFLYFERGDTLNEYRMIKAAAEAAPTDLFYLHHFGHLLLERLGDAPQALAVFQQAQQFHPDSTWILERLGYVHGLLGEYEQSAVLYRRAIERDPTDTHLHSGLAFTLERQGQLDAAIAASQQAIQAAPDDPDPHGRLAGLYYGRARYPEAIQEYEQAVALGENDPSRVAQLCMSYHLISEFQRAADCFEAVLRYDPRNALAQRMLPEVRNNLSRLEAAHR